MKALINTVYRIFTTKMLRRTLIAHSFGAIRAKHTLPDLPYKYNALEPVISAEIMELHHTKHHATYVNNLNKAEVELADAIQNGQAERAISITPAIRFNGGGHVNHSIFWTNLSPDGGGAPPKGPLADAICKEFNSYDNLRNIMSDQAVAVQGSGWAWLTRSARSGRMRVVTCQNQDACFPSTGFIPILGIDVWEHAYYLQYKNLRAEYVKSIWNVVNWRDVEARYIEALERKTDK